MLWPDDGTWYKGEVMECDVQNAKATVYYDETEETEECDLGELVRDGQIAFSERRSLAVPAAIAERSCPRAAGTREAPRQSAAQAH